MTKEQIAARKQLQDSATDKVRQVVDNWTDGERMIAYWILNKGYNITINNLEGRIKSFYDKQWKEIT